MVQLTPGSLALPESFGWILAEAENWVIFCTDSFIYILLD